MTGGDPINLYLIHLAVVERVIELDPALLETWVVGHLDASRRCVGMLITDNGPEAEKSMLVYPGLNGELTARDADADDAQPDSTPLAIVSWGDPWWLAD